MFKDFRWDDWEKITNRPPTARKTESNKNKNKNDKYYSERSSVRMPLDLGSKGWKEWERWRWRLVHSCIESVRIKIIRKRRLIIETGIQPTRRMWGYIGSIVVLVEEEEDQQQ